MNRPTPDPIEQSIGVVTSWKNYGKKSDSQPPEKALTETAPKQDNNASNRRGFGSSHS